MLVGRRGLAWTSVVVVVVSVLAGCCNDCGRGFTFRITNRTSDPVVVRLEEPGHQAEVATIEPDRTFEAGALFNGRPSCFGPWVARTTSGVEIGRLVSACPGSEWSIRPGAPPSPSESAAP